MLADARSFGEVSLSASTSTRRYVAEWRNSPYDVYATTYPMHQYFRESSRCITSVNDAAAKPERDRLLADDAMDGGVVRNKRQGISVDTGVAAPAAA